MVRMPILVATLSKRRGSAAARVLGLEFESRRRLGRMSVVSVVYCQVEVNATDLSLVQRSPTDCGASLCVIKKPRKRGGYSPLEGCENTTTMGCSPAYLSTQNARTHTKCYAAASPH